MRSCYTVSCKLTTRLTGQLMTGSCTRLFSSLKSLRLVLGPIQLSIQHTTFEICMLRGVMQLAHEAPPITTKVTNEQPYTSTLANTFLAHKGKSLTVIYG